MEDKSEGKTEEYFKFELEAAIEDARAASLKDTGISKADIRMLWDRVQSIRDEAQKAGFIL